MQRYTYHMTKFQYISQLMSKLGATRIIFKQLANNDNTKQQIYIGGDFEVIRAIPTGEVYADGISSKGPIFKAPVNFYWIDDSGNTEHAPNSKIILYPKYPEIRLSGFLKGTNKNLEITPRHLMQPPTKEERAERQGTHRYLVLGVSPDKVWAYCSSWGDDLARELSSIVEAGTARSVASVFFELTSKGKSSEDKLLDKLREIHRLGPIESCRLKADGSKIPYKAMNGAGYTLEAQFGITPNGSPDPDFMDWELKAHSGSVVTLLTPEPNTGTYVDLGLLEFMRRHATNKREGRLDFASRHKVNQENPKTELIMTMDGYDSAKGKITDPDGGLMLKDREGNIAAGWSFDKIIEHWKKKHSNTCYVSYKAEKPSGDREFPHYQFGPKVTLGQGTSLDHFLEGLHSCTIYFDPGMNMKLNEGKWKPKKRSQFRVNWTKIDRLYKSVRHLDLADV